MLITLQLQKKREVLFHFFTANSHNYEEMSIETDFVESCSSQ